MILAKQLGRVRECVRAATVATTAVATAAAAAANGLSQDKKRFDVGDLSEKQFLGA